VTSGSDRPSSLSSIVGSASVKWFWTRTFTAAVTRTVREIESLAPTGPGGRPRPTHGDHRPRSGSQRTARRRRRKPRPVPLVRPLRQHRGDRRRDRRRRGLPPPPPRTEIIGRNWAWIMLLAAVLCFGFGVYCGPLLSGHRPALRHTRSRRRAVPHRGGHARPHLPNHPRPPPQSPPPGRLWRKELAATAE
jgi:hypothetical protein